MKTHIYRVETLAEGILGTDQMVRTLAQLRLLPRAIKPFTESTCLADIITFLALARKMRDAERE